MSQPQSFGPGLSDPLAQPIEHISDLTQLFLRAQKPKCLIGIEYEMFGQIDNGANPLPYEGPVSITALFNRLAQVSKDGADPLAPIYEDENIVALTSKRAVIALEPGGQIELAISPYEEIGDTTRALASVMAQVRQAARDLSIDLFALGIHPVAGRQDMAVVKKARYGIMRDYMGRLGGLGLDMMTRSCAIQLNLDYKDQADMVEKTRLGAYLMPFYALMCSSSAFVDGRIAAHALERSHIWRKTDPNRTGIPKIIFDQGFGYQAWIEFALDVPMYFIRRREEYYDVSGASFREFLSTGLKGFRATFRDFIDHLSTIFTEVRLKPILELRSPDSLPVPFANALTVLTWAIFYDDRARTEVGDIFSGLDFHEFEVLQRDMIDYGRGAKFNGRKVMDVVGEVLAIGSRVISAKGDDELISSLHPLQNLSSKNMTCADWIKERYPSIDRQNLLSLIKQFDPLCQPLQ